MRRTAVILPGRGYSVFGPLLWYAAMAAIARGADVRPISWDKPPELGPGEGPGFVAGQIGPTLRKLVAAGAVPLVIGKSLGAFAAPLAAQLRLPAVWLTPVLTDPVMVRGIRASVAPTLLIGGTADRMWDGALARELTPFVLEVQGADHALQRPGDPLVASTTILGHVVSTIEGFLAEVVWP